MDRLHVCKNKNIYKYKSMAMNTGLKLLNKYVNKLETREGRKWN